MASSSLQLLPRVAVIGHSQLKPLLSVSKPDYLGSFTNLEIKILSASGAHCYDIYNTTAFSKLLTFSPDLIIVFLGGNDLVYGAIVAEIYESLVSLIDRIT